MLQVTYQKWHVKWSDNPERYNRHSQKWVKFGVLVLSKVLNNFTKFYFIWAGTFWDIGHWSKDIFSQRDP